MKRWIFAAKVKRCNFGCLIPTGSHSKIEGCLWHFSFTWMFASRGVNIGDLLFQIQFIHNVKSTIYKIKKNRDWRLTHSKDICNQTGGKFGDLLLQWLTPTAYFQHEKKRWLELNNWYFIIGSYREKMCVLCGRWFGDLPNNKGGEKVTYFLNFLLEMELSLGWLFYCYFCWENI